MKHKFAVFILGAMICAAGISTGYGRQQAQTSATDQQKIAALKDAYRNGLMTRDEYESKLSTITAAAALRDALNNGLLTQQEYEAKLRDLNEGLGPSYSGPPVATKAAWVFDSTLGTNFVAYDVPDGWFFQGGMVHGDACNIVSAAFLRVSSPDGLTGAKVFPRIDLGWSQNPASMPKEGSGCSPYEGEITANGFLQYMVSLFHLDYMRDLTDPADVEKMRSAWLSQPHLEVARYTFADGASALTRFQINSIEERERIDVAVRCMEHRFFRQAPLETCSVNVRLTWAPAGKLRAALEILKTLAKPTDNPEWIQRWSARAEAARQRDNAFWAQMTANNNAFYANLNRQTIANGEAFRAQMNNQFAVHEQGIQAMQSAGDNNLRLQQQRWNTQQRMADDTCDYALGVQKRLDPATGQMYKTNSSYTYDWVNSEGKHILTNNINDNPNGLGIGVYNLTQNVH